MYRPEQESGSGSSSSRETFTSFVVGSRGETGFFWVVSEKEEEEAGSSVVSVM